VKLIPFDLKRRQRRHNIIYVRPGGNITCQNLISVVKAAPSAGFGTDILPGFHIFITITGEVGCGLTENHLFYIEDGLREAQQSVKKGGNIRRILPGLRMERGIHPRMHLFERADMDLI